MLFQEAGALTDTLDDEDVERKEKLVAALARTVVYGALPLEFAPSILVHFLEYGKHCSDLIKTFLAKIRETTPAEDWKIVLATLTKVHHLAIATSH